MEGRSKIPRTVVHGSVLGPFEAQDFAIAFVGFSLIFLLTGSAIISLLTLGGSLLIIPQIEKLRYKKGPAFLQRWAWKELGIKPEKNLPDYKKIWFKV